MKQKSVRHPKGLPITLCPKTTYILPTRFGILFIVALVAMLLGSINYNNNLGFLLVFLLGSMAFVSIFYTYGNLRRINIQSVKTGPVFSGASATFMFSVTVDKPVRPEVSFQFQSGGRSALDLFPDRENAVYLSVKTRKRGYFHPGILEISTRYPFGLFKSWSKILPDVTCIVYPRPLSGALEQATRSAGGNGDAAGDIEGVDDFQGLRTYQPGDPMHRVSWKTYSRGQGLFTKVFRGTAGTSFFFDWQKIPGKSTEEKLSRMTYMVLESHRLSYEYGISLPGATVAAGRGEAHKHACLKKLALFGS